MRNKKGYLLYEMLLSFTFTFIIILNIFTVITNLSVKLANIYQKNSIYSKELSLYRKIGDDFMKNKITSIANCTVGTLKCVNITYVVEGVSTIKSIKKDTMTVTENGSPVVKNYIEYNNIKYVFDKANVGVPVLKTIDTLFAAPYNKIINLNIPIEYKDKHYDINLFYTNEMSASVDNNSNFF